MVLQNASHREGTSNSELLIGVPFTLSGIQRLLA